MDYFKENRKLIHARCNLFLILILVVANVNAQFPAQPDWLRSSNPLSTYKATVRTDEPNKVIISNGLITRSFTVSPNWYTSDYRNEIGVGTSFIRGVSPEARLFFDNAETGVDIGGVLGQSRFLLLVPETFTPSVNPLGMVFVNYSISSIIPQYEYTPRWGVLNTSWPPPGIRLSVNFAAPVDPGPSNFTTLEGTGVGCDPPLTCLTGYSKCDNTSVPGQCTFPINTAVEDCAEWSLCKAVTCNHGRNDCQARGRITQLYSAGFTSYIRGGFFPYPQVTATVYYELYDGVPVLTKWVEVRNGNTTSNDTQSSVPLLSQITIERLHVPWNLRTRLHAETAYMPHQGERNSMEDAGWYPASGGYAANFTSLTSQPVNMWNYDEELMGPWGQDGALEYFYDMGLNETLLEVKYPFGPGLTLNTSLPPYFGVFDSFRVYESLHDSDDLERQSLTRRKLLRATAPATTTDMGPAIMVGGDSASIRDAADTIGPLGFRMLHTSVDPFNFDPAYIARVAADVAYGHSKGLILGFYVLLQNPPGLTPENEVINPDTGNGEGIACFATTFHETFRNNLLRFVQATGFDFMDTDGPYEQAPCGSKSHEHHRDLLDSQVAQFHDNVAWYQTLWSAPNPLSLVGTGVMISCPDPYEQVAGTTMQPIGYTDAWGRVEDRWEWLVTGRVYIHDGTFWKPPTNGAINLDLNRAGSMSSDDDLAFLDVGLAQFLGVAGRSFQYGALYQNSASQALWVKWMGWLQQYRSILASDIIHIRKPDGRSWDAMMHVDPTSKDGDPKGFALFFNPTNSTIAVNFGLSVYYCGFEPGTSVNMLWMNGTSANIQQEAFFTLPVASVLKPRGYDWVVLS